MKQRWRRDGRLPSGPRWSIRSVGEATLRVHQGSISGIGREHATAGVAVGAYQLHNSGALLGGLRGSTCAPNRGVRSHNRLSRSRLGSHRLLPAHNKYALRGSYVSYNSHGLLYVTCTTLFRGYLVNSPVGRGLKSFDSFEPLFAQTLVSSRG